MIFEQVGKSLTLYTHTTVSRYYHHLLFALLPEALVSLVNTVLPLLVTVLRSHAALHSTVLLDIVDTIGRLQGDHVEKKIQCFRRWPEMYGSIIWTWELTTKQSAGNANSLEIERAPNESLPPGYCSVRTQEINSELYRQFSTKPDCSVSSIMQGVSVSWYGIHTQLTECRESPHNCAAIRGDNMYMVLRLDHEVWVSDTFLHCNGGQKREAIGQQLVWKSNRASCHQCIHRPQLIILCLKPLTWWLRRQEKKIAIFRIAPQYLLIVLHPDCKKPISQWSSREKEALGARCLWDLMIHLLILPTLSLAYN